MSQYSCCIDSVRAVVRVATSQYKSWVLDNPQTLARRPYCLLVFSQRIYFISRALRQTGPKVRLIGRPTELGTLAPCGRCSTAKSWWRSRRHRWWHGVVLPSPVESRWPEGARSVCRSQCRDDESGPTKGRRRCGSGDRWRVFLSTSGKTLHQGSHQCCFPPLHWSKSRPEGCLE